MAKKLSRLELRDPAATRFVDQVVPAINAHADDIVSITQRVTTLEDQGLRLTSPDGSVWVASIDNAGAVTWTKM